VGVAVAPFSARIQKRNLYLCPCLCEWAGALMITWAWLLHCCAVAAGIAVAAVFATCIAVAALMANVADVAVAAGFFFRVGFIAFSLEASVAMIAVAAVVSTSVAADVAAVAAVVSTPVMADVAVVASIAVADVAAVVATPVMTDVALDPDVAVASSAL